MSNLWWFLSEVQIVYIGLIRGVSGVSVDTPRIFEISTAEPQFYSVRRSKIWLIPLGENPNEASDMLLSFLSFFSEWRGKTKGKS